ncbi:hypothetical protein D3C76_272490 [compost metagenome]
MVAESACHKNSAILIRRIGVVSKTPCSPINRVHEVGFAGNYTNRKSSADNFSVSYQIRRNAEPGLRSPRLNTEARNHLIKNQSCAGSLGNRTNFCQKLLRLQIRSAALYRLYQNSRQLMSMSANVFK